MLWYFLVSPSQLIFFYKCIIVHISKAIHTIPILSWLFLNPMTLNDIIVLIERIIVLNII